MLIEKTARRGDHFRRPFLRFRNARAALGSYLAALRFEPQDRVLLPAYVGWSPREGSGVFDPIRTLGLGYAFYRLTPDLTADLDSLGEALQQQRVRAVVLIHYFGRMDPNTAAAAEMARNAGAVLIEDEAHAMYTDLVAGRVGRFGDVSIFSLHKMLPTSDGGLLLFNRGPADAVPLDGTGQVAGMLPWDYDLSAIAERRKDNARRLAQLLEPLHGTVDPLWAGWPSSDVPQTFPVLVREVPRDALYFRMNEAGFGVVTLYHTLISELTPSDYPESHALSRRILNLPVHQDADPAQLRPMVVELERAVRELSGAAA